MNGVITGSIEVVAQLGEARDTLQRALLLLESADARLPEPEQGAVRVLLAELRHAARGLANVAALLGASLPVHQAGARNPGQRRRTA